jgi:thiol-disulfide isomerase/thioredoxin
MKRIFAFILLAAAVPAMAQTSTPKTPASKAPAGYEIKVTLKPFKNQYIYLGHYYGKQLPIIDSVVLNEKSEGVFKGTKKLGGGIYLVGFPDRARNFEILIDKAQHFSVVADTANLAHLRFQHSPENIAFQEYQEAMGRSGRAIDALMRQRQGAPAADSIRITGEVAKMQQSVQEYRNSVISKEPDGILATLLKAMKEPEVPQNHPQAAKDSLFAYKYFKAHYWDGVNFWDDRVARTPFFEPRLDKYFEKLVYPAADSVNKEIDWMLGYASISDEMQKFLLLKFINRYYNQQYMWEDAVFVHLFQKYLAQKSYAWMTESGKKMITDRAYSLMANLTGNAASDIELPGLDGKSKKLYDIQSPYVLVAIYDPTCGHCKEVIPRIDSLHSAKWKARGVRLFGMAKETEGNKETWTSFIKDHKLADWTHVYYSRASEKARVDAGIPSYSQLYDVQSFPTLYLLDKDKRIIAKKVTEQQVDEILEYRKEK